MSRSIYLSTLKKQIGIKFRFTTFMNYHKTINNKMSYNKLTILALCLYQTFSCFAQSINLDSLKQESTNVIYHKLGDAVRIPAFEHPDYWVWGGTVTKQV